MFQIGIRKVLLESCGHHPQGVLSSSLLCVTQGVRFGVGSSSNYGIPSLAVCKMRIIAVDWGLYLGLPIYGNSCIGSCAGIAK